MLESGWKRAETTGSSLAGVKVGHQIDHALVSGGTVESAELMHQVGRFQLCRKGALSDHAGLVVDVDVGEGNSSHLYEGCWGER